jgi:hypothetical protein
MSFTTKQNEVTGKMEVQFQGTLTSVSAETKENSNGKKYHTVGIQFQNAKGETLNTVGIMHQANFEKGVTVGEKYLCTGSKGDNGNLLIQMSHLQGSTISAEDAFGSVFATAETTATATA